MRKNPALDFYEIQKQQWRKSLFLFLVLIVFYFLAVGFISFVLVLCFSIFFRGGWFPSQNILRTLILINSAVSIIIASAHFFDARKFGAKFIIKRLQAQQPDLSDRYHKQFVNTVEEMRIASGLPKVIPYIFPTFAINSMALIQPDNTPTVIVTEGLLAEFTRDELQAVVAHELAHIIRGDAFYLTLVCSLANSFERVRQAIEPEKLQRAGKYRSQRGGAAPYLIYFAVTVSAIIMHLLSTLISRQREVLADAAAVELSRNPRALARAIYKADVKNSFVGDFNLTYSPLFIVPPKSRGESGGFLSRLFNSHPPLIERIKLLANMIPTRPGNIIREIWDIQKTRRKAKVILKSQEELPEISGTALQTQEISQEEGKVWAIHDPKGNWQGSFALEELLFHRYFTPKRWIKNLQEDVEALANEFPQIRGALRNLGKKKPINPAKQNKCPRCRIALSESYYEGIPAKICSRCQGKLVDSVHMNRVIARKEVGFSEQLIKKAKEFKENFLLNPFQRKKIDLEKSPKIYCPNCGYRMVPRPYNYQYIVPVDKCFSCNKIWFDSDELEILQILIEKR
ncbi:MAG: M48 family metalloprotease [Candidatus Aminicenantes bacterium]|nr:MAG: M48 family metalloprotease [Candidatus Aminicenantes bacterium]